MGITYVEGTVAGPHGERTIKFLVDSGATYVDSGATYTVLPEDVWRSIGIEPSRTAHFSLADGTMIERKVSECRITLPDGTAHSPIVLGEPGDEALLGIVTLENIGLVLNPVTRQLQPLRMLLAGVSNRYGKVMTSAR